MAGQRDDKSMGEKPQGGSGTPPTRHARLEQQLRANLLKRKAQNRARKASQAPPKEGGTD
jgi:hypothetical protein